MPLKILVIYGSYRTDRRGIRLANYILEGLRTRGDDAVLIDAKSVGLPMLDRMYKEYPKRALPLPRWNRSPPTFAPPTHSYSSSANTTGAFNRASRI
jgi:hypothetical protein